MANVENQDSEGTVQSGTVLNITNAASENEVTLAVENYLRLNKKEELEFALPKSEENGVYRVTLK